MAQILIELVPRVVEALAGKSVVGVSAVWTAQGALFRWGDSPGLRHGGPENELTPGLVEGLAGTMVVGAAADIDCTASAAWTDAG